MSKTRRRTGLQAGYTEQQIRDTIEYEKRKYATNMELYFHHRSKMEETSQKANEAQDNIQYLEKMLKGQKSKFDLGKDWDEEQEDAHRKYYLSLPTIHSGHFDNLKLEDDFTRIWVSRVEYGKTGKPLITIENLIAGKWEVTKTF